MPQRFPSSNPLPGDLPFVDVTLTGTYEASYKDGVLNLDIPLFCIQTEGYNPQEIEHNIRRELEREIRESNELERIASLSAYLPRDLESTAWGKIPPIKTHKNTAKGIAECMVQFLCETIVSILSQRNLDKAEETRDRMEALARYNVIHEPIKLPPRLDAATVDRMRNPPPGPCNEIFNTMEAWFADQGLEDPDKMLIDLARKRSAIPVDTASAEPRFMQTSAPSDSSGPMPHLKSSETETPPMDVPAEPDIQHKSAFWPDNSLENHHVSNTHKRMDTAVKMLVNILEGEITHPEQLDRLRYTLSGDTVTVVLTDKAVTLGKRLLERLNGSDAFAFRAAVDNIKARLGIQDPLHHPRRYAWGVAIEWLLRHPAIDDRGIESALEGAKQHEELSRQGKVRLEIMINNNWWGHAGFRIYEGSEAILYDPGGSYTGHFKRSPYDEHGNKRDPRPSRAAFYGEPRHFDWEDYIAYHLNDGPKVKGYIFLIPEDQATRIKELIRIFGNPGALNCTTAISALLQKSGGIFSNISNSTFPWSLGSGLEKLEGVILVRY